MFCVCMCSLQISRLEAELKKEKEDMMKLRQEQLPQLEKTAREVAKITTHSKQQSQTVASLGQDLVQAQVKGTLCILSLSTVVLMMQVCQHYVHTFEKFHLHYKSDPTFDRFVWSKNACTQKW